MALSLQSRVRGDKDMHPHRWRMHMHMDGCHWYSSVYVCVRCGSSLGTYDERDLSEDPWSAVWMDADGEGSACLRCEELMSGAEAVHKLDLQPA